MKFVYWIRDVDDPYVHKLTLTPVNEAVIEFLVTTFTGAFVVSGRLKWDGCIDFTIHKFWHSCHPQDDHGNNLIRTVYYCAIPVFMSSNALGHGPEYDEDDCNPRWEVMQYQPTEKEER